MMLPGAMEISYELINESIDESIIPQNFSWRAGINDPATKPQGPFGDPGAAIAKAFVHQFDRTPPKVELPQIRKSKQAQYWDAVLNNGVIWKTGEDDTRPETDADLKVQQNPVLINEPEITNDKPNDFKIQYTGMNATDYNFDELPVNGLPNIQI